VSQSQICAPIDISSHLGAPYFFNGAGAERLGAGLGLTRMLFHAPKNISCLMDQIKSHRAWWVVEAFSSFQTDALNLRCPM
jgi:hypothetical protein